MPQSDAQRWNERYRSQPRYQRFTLPRPFLVEQAAWLPAPGLALDLAMGMGGNAGFLLQRGWRVLGIDISEIAVRTAHRRWPGLMAVVADLAAGALPALRCDLLLNFYYLQRELWPELARLLRPGGLLIFESLTQDMLSTHPEIDPAYLLAPGELRQAFSDWEVLVYREGWVGQASGHPRAVASLVALNPYRSL